MALDEGKAQCDINGLQEQLQKSSKSKHQKTKPDEQCITFKELTGFPYVMWQSAWELDWDRMKALYDFRLGVSA